MDEPSRAIFYMGSTKKDLQKLPAAVREVFAHGLSLALIGETPSRAKALKGFGGRSVLELVEDYKGDTYRAVYTVRIKEAIYVLHVFKKKSTKGIATPKQVIELVKWRLKIALANHKKS